MDRKLVDLTIWTGTLAPVIWWHAHLPTSFAWFMQGDLVGGLPPWIGTAALVCVLSVMSGFEAETAEQMALFGAGDERPGRDRASDALSEVTDQLKERFGDRWSPAGIASMSEDDVVEVFCRKPAVHRYPAAMARRAHGIAQVIVDEYDGDTASIWTTAKSGETLYKRVSSLPGFAEEKSQIFVALLAKRFDVKPRGWKTAAGAFSDDQPRSAADVDSLPKLREVQAWKKAQKAAKKSKSEFSM